MSSLATFSRSPPGDTTEDVEEEEPVSIMIASQSSVSHVSFSGEEDNIHGCSGSDGEQEVDDVTKHGFHNSNTVCVSMESSPESILKDDEPPRRVDEPNVCTDATTKILLSEGEKCTSHDPEGISHGKVNINSTSRRGPCCICSSPALYTCPGCNRSTCCISCSRSHKALMNCSGMPDPAVKVSLNEFTDRQLQRDFKFLEDCRRALDNIERAKPSLIPDAVLAPLHGSVSLPREAKELQDAARQRGWLCQITSAGMRKREANTSYWSRSDNIIYWRCDFQFYRGVDVAFTLTARGDERYRLCDVLGQCWRKNLPSLPFATSYSEVNSSDSKSECSQNPECPKGKAFPSSSTCLSTLPIKVDTKSSATKQDVGALLSPEEVVNKSMLESFLQFHGNDVFLLYKAERQGTRTLYVPLSLDSTISQSLHKICFVTEYPVFMVVGRRDLSSFPLASSEDLLGMRKLLGSLLRQAVPELHGDTRQNRRRRKQRRKEGASDNEANETSTYRSNGNKRPREGPPNSKPKG